MEIYLVRHGQTGGNVAHRHQAEDTQLSFIGEQQVREVAELIKQYEPTHLVTSNLVRAIETSRIICDACDLIPETNHNFIELVRPKNMYGHHHKSIKSIWFYFQWLLGKDSNITNGGESYETLRERFLLAQDYLKQYPKDAKVVVVSHAAFIGLFVAHLCRKKALNPLEAAFVFHKILTMPNTHIIKLRLNTESDTGICAWSLDN